MPDLEIQSHSLANPDKTPVQPAPSRIRQISKYVTIICLVFALLFCTFYGGTSYGYSTGYNSGFASAAASKSLSSKLVITNDGSCGATGSCPGSTCCSQFGYCGSSDAFCGAGCQSAFGTCTTPYPTAQEWGNCNATSICPSSFTCCVGPADSATGKTTCRQTGQSGLASGCMASNAPIPAWSSCNAVTDTCQSGFSCCVGPSDVFSGKNTCRQSGAINQSYGCAATTVTVAPWNNCDPATTPCSAGYTCCTAPADASNGKTTCRLPGLSGQSSGCAATPTSTTSTTPVITNISFNGSCGGNLHCPALNCCSAFGYCGSAAIFCGAGCQPAFGICY